MNQPNQTPSFLDRGTVIALVLVALVWFGWSKWVEKNYPTPQASQPLATPSSAPNAVADGKSNPDAKPDSNVMGVGDTGKSSVATGDKTKPASAARVAESKEKLATTQWTGDLSNWGMGLSAIELKQYKTRDEKPILVGATPVGLFSTRLLGSPEPIVFAVTRKSDSEWLGVATLDGYRVEKTISLVSEGEASGRAVKITTVATGDLSKFPGFSVVISDEVRAPVSTSFLAPSHDHHDWYIRHEDTNKRQIIAPDKPEPLQLHMAVAAALSSHYFTAAIADQSALRPDFSSQAPIKDGEGFMALGQLDYKPMTKDSEFKIQQVAYVGAKDVDSLRAADANLSRVIDYGMFAVLADPLLWLMRFFHSIFGNWGFAIIGLTLVVRVLVLPFNVYSFKSMKVMQKLQPQIQSMKEKYKDDSRRMNEEVMKLMRENKANPVGGCLPMLLQLPVFFALYQVLAMSIELYRQPFIFWIHDLTIKDPYYVVPVLMGIAMYFQQKLTPVADPQQAKILQWMPVIFSFLMISLPSGLTLYILVSTLFGMTQQYVFMRDKLAATTQNTVREAKA